MAKRATTTAKKPAAKRELMSPRGDKRYIRRDAAGRIKESDDVPGSPPAGEEGRQVRAGRPWGPEACLESFGTEKDACQTLVIPSIFLGTTLFLRV
jgi:hypothetical protein